MRAVIEVLMILVTLAVGLIFFTSCGSSKIPRLTSDTAPITNTQNTQVGTLLEPVTGEIIQNQQQVITAPTNAVFGYFVLVVICLCALCAIPNMVNYFRANRLRASQSSRDDKRIVLND